MVFNGTITGTPALATGSGTENDPYQISTAEALKWFRDKVNNAKTPDETKICAVLTADIDLNNEESATFAIFIIILICYNKVNEGCADKAKNRRRCSYGKE